MDRESKRKSGLWHLCDNNLVRRDLRPASVTSEMVNSSSEENDSEQKC